VFLPRATEMAEAEAKPGKASPARRGDETLLIAEDEPYVRDLLSDVLAAEGYQVLSAHDGGDALLKAARTPGQSTCWSRTW